MATQRNHSEANTLTITQGDARHDNSGAGTTDVRHGRRRGAHRRVRGHRPSWLAQGEVTPGALRARYDIPDAELRQSRRWLLVPVAALPVIYYTARHLFEVHNYEGDRLLMTLWTLYFVFAAVTWLLSWRDRPTTVTEEQSAELGKLRVVVNVPVYNEDPTLLDRSLWALINQSRPVQLVDVIDDGSDTDYTELREYWVRIWGNGTEVRWTRTVNGGKKEAQGLTFVSDPRADVFVTVDSDTALTHNAIEEGLKPFIDDEVQSVAGMELALNVNTNWLTRIVTARSIAFQVISCGAQAAFGEVLVNRGTYALYRSGMVRKFVAAYLEETFLGRPVHLGDDAALTLFASCTGKAVQQSSAFCFAMYPEHLSHHFRQWLRWMRGSTIRNCWRIRYLPITSFSWWFTFTGLAVFLGTVFMPLVLIISWRTSQHYIISMLVASIGWSYLVGLRIFSVKCSNESFWYRLGTLFCYVPAILWTSLVLRPIRLYGIFTCLRQGWITRVHGVEVAAHLAPEE
jgi:hyaluronan synthase